MKQKKTLDKNYSWEMKLHYTRIGGNKKGSWNES